jgi:O-antigen/teichoic acid export membrane protein
VHLCVRADLYPVELAAVTRMKRLVARNVIWNWAGMANQMLVGFVVAPFLVHRLGDSRYGLWVLIASMTGYFDLLDLGVRGSVGRNIAFFRAKNDHAGVNALLSTALAVLVGVAVLVLLGTLALAVGFFHLFDVPDADGPSVRLALLIVGINLALTFPLSVFDATLWAMHRFDVLNAIDIPVALLRAGLTFWWIGSGNGLVAMALITVLTTVLAAVIKAILSFRLDRNLNVRLRWINREAARSLFGYGLWYFLLSTGRRITPQVSPLVIGARLGVGFVTPQNIAARLTGYASSLLISATGVMTPVAAGLHAEDNHEKQRTLFLEGGKICLAFVLFFVTLFLFLGKPLIELWMGPDKEAASKLLIIMALGEIVPMSQWITYSVVLGMGRHRELAYFFLLENVLAIVLALALVGSFGLVGVCVAVAIPGALCRGLCQLVYGCRLVKVSFGTYAGRVLIPALVTAALPVTALAVVTRLKSPTSWVELLVYTAIFGVFYLGMGLVTLIGYGRLKWRGVQIMRGALGVR